MPGRRSNPVVIAAGINSVYLSCIGVVPASLLEKIRQAQHEASTQARLFAVEGWLWSEGDTPYAVAVRPHGRRQYGYSLLVEGYWELMLAASYDTPGMCGGTLQVRSGYLWSHGWQRAVERTCELLRHVFGFDATIQMTRMDPAIDLVGWHLLPGDRERFVTRAVKRDERMGDVPEEADTDGATHHEGPDVSRTNARGRAISGIHLGGDKALVQMQIYRKDWEMQQQAGSAWYAAVAAAAGWDQDKPLVRVRAQLQKDYLAQFVRNRDPVALLRCLGDIVEDVFRNQARYVVPGRSLARRRKVVGWWSDLPMHFLTAPTGVQRQVHVPAVNERQLLDTTAGCLAAIGAQRGWTEDELLAALPELLAVRLKERGLTMAALLRDKALDRGAATAEYLRRLE